MRQQKPKLRIFGERNTGSRAVTSMLEAAGIRCGPFGNVPAEVGNRAEVLNHAVRAQLAHPWRRVYEDAIKDQIFAARGPLGAWKHAAPRYDPAFAAEWVDVMFLLRDPYSWCVSLWQHPYHNRGPRPEGLAAFLERPWMTLGRDGLAPVLPSPACLWAQKVASYYDFAAKARADGVRVGWLSFEQFVADPTGALKHAVGQVTDAAIRLEPVPNTKPDGRSLEDIRHYHQAQKWRRHLDARAIDLINAHIPAKLMERTGYRVLRADTSLDRKAGAATAA